MRLQLESGLHPVTLLWGPASVGKWTLAEHAVKFHGAIPAEVVRAEKLTAERAREIIRSVRVAPFGKFRAVIMRLDGASSESLNAMLKLLEEPPKYARFLLVSSRPPLPTVKSRAVVVPMGLLTDDEVTAVLMQSGMDQDFAARAAVLGAGQVQPAQDSDAAGSARATVTSVLRAIAESDRELAARVLSSWNVETHSMFLTWALEASSGRWRVFTEAESFGLADGSVPRQLVARLATVGSARPRVAARVVVESLLR